MASSHSTRKKHADPDRDFQDTLLISVIDAAVKLLDQEEPALATSVLLLLSRNLQAP